MGLQNTHGMCRQFTRYPVRFNVERNNSHKVGRLLNSSRHRLTFGMLPSEQATCDVDRDVGNTRVARIRDELDAAGFSAVKVGTVEKGCATTKPPKHRSSTCPVRHVSSSLRNDRHGSAGSPQYQRLSDKPLFKPDEGNAYFVNGA
jgi:hypothetical protein